MRYRLFSWLKAVRWPLTVYFVLFWSLVDSCLIDNHSTSSFLYVYCLHQHHSDSYICLSCWILVTLYTWIYIHFILDWNFLQSFVVLEIVVTGRCSTIDQSVFCTSTVCIRVNRTLQNRHAIRFLYIEPDDSCFILYFRDRFEWCYKRGKDSVGWKRGGGMLATTSHWLLFIVEVICYCFITTSQWSLYNVNKTKMSTRRAKMSALNQRSPRRILK